jgi:predicted DCC family thiol-disulfide oxidoreductase YuxK
METLTVLYDESCAFCRGVRSWLEAQPSYVRLEFIAAGSEEVRRRYPDLDHGATLQDLTVISDTGDIYAGAAGWLMCLWALRNYRAWSLTLSSPSLIPQAQRFISWISQNRLRLGQSKQDACGDEGCAIMHMDELQSDAV